VVTGKAAEYTALVNQIAQEHKVTVKWRRRPEIPAGAIAYARVSAREIVTPIIEGDDVACDQLFAIALHEIGHCLSERCKGGDHAAVNDGRWHSCLRCETLASEKAMTLTKFSRAMFDELSRGLSAYRRRTPGPQSAVAALDRQRGSLAFAEHRQGIVNRSIDVLRARHEWALLSEQQRLDRRVALQKAEMEQMRARRRAREGQGHAI
jgi:hypothetical protein